MEKHIFQSGEKMNNSRKKKFSPKDLVVYSFCFFLLTLSYLKDKNPELKISNIKLTKLTVDDVEEKINSSINLNDEEKEYLCNDKYFEDILPYINKSIISRTYLNNNIDNIRIKSYGKEDMEYETADGYYTNVDPQTLYVRDYEGIKTRKDTVSHELMHLCQVPLEKNIIKEACAEIISYEYFGDTEMNAYSREVILVKTLMEIIGPGPVWYYNFTGDFSQIEDAVRPYLSFEDYEIFLKMTGFEEDESAKSKLYMKLSGVMEKLYKNKYGEDICKNEIIDAIRHNKPVCRYYFNEEHINEEESYYMNRELQTIDTRKAYDLGYISFYRKYFDVIPKERAIDFLKDSLFSGKIEAFKDDGFEEVSYTDLLSDPITYPFYFVKGRRPVTFEEFYENNKELSPDSDYEYDGNDVFVKSLDLDGDVEIYMYVKKYVPPIKKVGKVRKLVKED